MNKIIFLILMAFSVKSFGGDNVYFQNEKPLQYPLLLAEADSKEKSESKKIGSDEGDSVKDESVEGKSEEELIYMSLTDEGKEVFKECARGPGIVPYIKCGCMAEVFELRRSTDSVTDQTNIFHDILIDSKNNCVDEEHIKKHMIHECELSASILSFSEPEDKKAFCPCVLDGFAKSFLKKPIVSSKYISQLKFKAMTECRM